MARHRSRKEGSRMIDLLLDNLWWPFLGGVLLGAICAGAGWAIGKLRGRST